MNSKLENMSFDEAFEQLETILEKLESGNETLENNLQLYSKGVELYSKCKNELDNAKLKIEYLNNGKTEEQICEFQRKV